MPPNVHLAQPLLSTKKGLSELREGLTAAPPACEQIGLLRRFLSPKARAVHRTNLENFSNFKEWQVRLRRQGELVCLVGFIASSALVGVGLAQNRPSLFFLVLPCCAIVLVLLSRLIIWNPRPSILEPIIKSEGGTQTACGGVGFLGGLLIGAKIGAGIGIAAGPFGAIAGTIPGAVVGAIIGMLGGNAIGKQIEKPEHSISQNAGKRVAAATGLIAGAGAGALIGSHIGLVAGPLGAIAGTVPGAIIGALVGILGGSAVADGSN